jgi:hypothetical protein
MLAALFGIACAVSGFAIGWNICKSETLQDLADKGVLDKEYYKNEMQKLM